VRLKGLGGPDELSSVGHGEGGTSNVRGDIIVVATASAGQVIMPSRDLPTETWIGDVW
jgi:hypothetical protein